MAPCSILKFNIRNASWHYGLRPAHAGACRRILSYHHAYHPGAGGLPVRARAVGSVGSGSGDGASPRLPGPRAASATPPRRIGGRPDGARPASGGSAAVCTRFL